MGGSAFSNFMGNPKFMMKAFYMSLMVFGAFHVTKTGLALVTSKLLSRMGKPQLVRETSKLYSNNYLTMPFYYARKKVLSNMKRSENDLLAGVILEQKLEN